MIIDQLTTFIEESKNKRVNNTWLEDDLIKIYIRKGRRLYKGDPFTTLEIANVSIEEEINQKKGLFSAFLTKAHELNPWQATYIENVINPFLFNHLLKKGWHLNDKTILTTENCFFLFKTTCFNGTNYVKLDY